MRLEEIKRQPYRHDLEEQEAIEIARDKFLSYFRLYEQAPVYRGSFVGERSPFQIGDPKLIGRKSQNTSNEYTVLLSGLPSWKAYPPRSQSIIATGDYSTARQYGGRGGVYAVVLPDRFRMGVCSQSDIWDSFEYVEAQVSAGYYGSGFGDHFAKFLSEITGFEANQQTTVNDIRNALQEFQNNVTTSDQQDDNPLRTYIVSRLKPQSPPNTAFRILEKLLDPALNGFSLITSVRDLDDLDWQEVWTDSLCMFVKAEAYQQFRGKVLNETT
jgi:hypothetical protein